MELNCRKILVPVDFSNISLAALDHAGYIAQQFGATIQIFHVLDLSENYSTLLGEQVPDDQLANTIVDQLRDVANTKQLLKGVAVDVEVKTGKVHREIQEAAIAGQFDLVVMGTHGSSGIGKLSRFVLGSNAYRVVHGSPCSVITIREQMDEVKFKNIVLPLDITKDTQQKVNIAIAWAKKFGAKLHVLSVSTLLDEYKMDLPLITHQLTTVADKVKEAGVECETKMIKQESVGSTAIRYANDIHADLIIIMTRQEAAWNEMFVGSSARKIISEAEVPVMSIRPSEVR